MCDYLVNICLPSWAVSPGRAEPELTQSPLCPHHCPDTGPDTGGLEEEAFRECLLKA